MRLFLVLFFITVASSLSACGPDTNCVLGERHYRIAHSEHAPNGAIIFAHGYRGSARGIMRNKNLRAMADDMGIALIAVKSLRDDWALPNAPGNKSNDGSEEFAYFEAVLEDAASRFGLNRDKVMMSGFSAGGMMVWELACKRPALFAGFAPVAGTFWKGPPETCAAPASIIHIHGTADKTVPLEGRKIADTRQGNILETLKMYQAFAGFGEAETTTLETMDCARSRNGTAHVLEFCTHPGGHSFSRTYLRYAWERLEAAGRL